MTASRISFLAFMILCVGLFCTLGIWQVKRLHWKENLIAQIDAAYANDPGKKDIAEKDILSLEKDHFLRGHFSGRFYFSKSFDLMGQIDEGKQTSHKMVPLEISKNLTVLVDMGPDFKAPGDQRASITGLLKTAPLRNRFTPENMPSQNIWYSIDPAQLSITNLKPLVILPETTPWKTFEGKKPELRNAHLQYAIFWFSMAAVIAALTLFYLCRK